MPDCSALRYWESGTEGERVSVIESAVFPGHIELWRPNPRKRASANGPESGWLVVISLPGHCDLGMQSSCYDSAIVLCLRRPMPCAAGSSTLSPTVGESTNSLGRAALPHLLSPTVGESLGRAMPPWGEPGRLEILSCSPPLWGRALGMLGRAFDYARS